MPRFCVSALLLGAVCLPAWADPLAITPIATSGQPAQSASEQSPPPVVAPVQVATAQPNFGGGFIQFLFGGASPAASAPAIDQAPPVNAGSAPAPQSVALANDPGSASADTSDDGHPAVDPKYDRQEVPYQTEELPGTILIDTPHHFLYLVEDGGKALRYGIGVGRPGFTWAGVKTITAKHEWPDWRPPVAMLKRQPELPRFMAGGPQNPLGARAMYLGSTDYRIHGSNEPWTIGHNVSSGCIRLRNADVIDLYNRVKVGTKVVVM
jgi:lipoprotein-anchoring transpeptidase ErfK/SrfK